MVKKKDLAELKAAGAIPQILREYGYTPKDPDKLPEIMAKVQQKADDYFKRIDPEDPEGKALLPHTVNGLILWMGFNCRDTFFNSMNDLKNYPGLSDILKKAHQRVMEFYENRGMQKKNPAFEIFSLKTMGQIESQVIMHEAGDTLRKRLFDD